MVTTDVEETLEMAARSQTRKAVKPVRNHIRILVIDDDESVCNTVKTLLERNGFQVRATCSPLEGVQLASQESFHIALIGLKMQEMGGVEVTTRITEADQHVACMIMTAYPDLDTATAAMRAGCKDYVTKPFRQEELLAAVDRTCRAIGLIYTDESELNRLIGHRIRQARLGKKMTLRQLAQLTELTTSQLSQVELGKNAASVWALARISTALGYQISKLLNGL